MPADSWSSLDRYEEWMRAALALADRAAEAGDVPVGAVVVDQHGNVLAEGWNTREVDHDPLAHAEIVALRAAAERRGSWRLDGCTIVVTLEPCVMCAGAIAAARVSRVVFGALDEKAGAVVSRYRLLDDPGAPIRAEIVAAVLRHESEERLRNFFVARRPSSEVEG